MTTGRLLIVDDEPSVLASYARSLSGAGFTVTKAATAEAALRRLERDQFEAVLSDLSMPAMNGLALLRRLRHTSPNLPVIMMLDAPDNNAAIQAMELGAVQSLVKPIAAGLLAETAAYAVRLYRSGPSVPTTFRPQSVNRPAATSISATDAKNEFGRLLEKVIQGGTVVITKHDAPKAVLISVDEFDSLVHANQDKLDALSDEFDALLTRMQAPAARSAMQTAFGASPKQLGRAALAASRKRG
ncbi:MAG TPA: type II toxin-antitoxin system prevent-host-death family antitoxin [Bryobacteraceae bacterium]|nr:type II toxin-antitoxin system prevent-host-death family antitoxin [Bryobacteraceae bacterium]